MDHQLFALLQGFYSLTPVNKLDFPKGLSPNAINNFLLHDILLDPHFLQYPPSRQYQKQFWKWVIGILEQIPVEDDDDDFEVDLRIYKHYFALLPPSGPAIGSSNPDTRDQTCGRGLAFQSEPPSNSYVTHFWTPYPLPAAESDHPIDLTQYQKATLLESRFMIEGGTTGLRTWLASFILARYLIDHPDIVASKRVLDLGSGIGFLGIIVATLQSLQRISFPEPHEALWLTDVNDEVLVRCRHNVSLPCNTSSTHDNIHYSELDWSASIDEERAPILESLIQEVDANVILGADVVFNPALVPSLIGALKIALQPPGTNKRALIAVTIRNPSTLELFMNMAKVLFQVDEIDLGSQRQVVFETLDVGDVNIKLFSIRL